MNTGNRGAEVGLGPGGAVCKIKREENRSVLSIKAPMARDSHGTASNSSPGRDGERSTIAAVFPTVAIDTAGQSKVRMTVFGYA